MTLLDAAGKSHWHVGIRQQKDGATIYRFPIPRSQAVALEYKYRPWETVELSNVSLVPGRRTNASVRTRPSRLPP